MVTYDKLNKRLIFTGNSPTPQFWDQIWEKKQNEKKSILNKIDLIVVPTTKKYLKKGEKVLEGGCGHGSYVELLNNNGFKCIGIDFAKETIKKLNKRFPDLPIYYGDLTKLNFKKNSFNGYWSLGVIEHFYDGYEKIILQIEKVLKPGGYAFVTFPYMSPLRKFKARQGLYEDFGSASKPKDFYQFALNHDEVIYNFKKNGFKVIEVKPFDGFAGLKKEIPQLNIIFNPIANYSTANIIVAGIRFIISKVTQSFTSHSILIVFQKKSR